MEALTLKDGSSQSCHCSSMCLMGQGMFAGGGQSLLQWCLDGCTTMVAETGRLRHGQLQSVSCMAFVSYRRKTCGCQLVPMPWQTMHQQHCGCRSKRTLTLNCELLCIAHVLLSTRKLARSWWSSWWDLRLQQWHVAVSSQPAPTSGYCKSFDNTQYCAWCL